MYLCLTARHRDYSMDVKDYAKLYYFVKTDVTECYEQGTSTYQSIQIFVLIETKYGLDYLTAKEHIWL